MPGLAESRWAPKYNHAITYSKSSRSNGYSTTTQTTTTRATTTTHPLPIQSFPNIPPLSLPASYNELTRYTKIVRRLKWKLPYLASGYRQAVERDDPHTDPSPAAEAELMFKIDFFEYYMLVERALVHLLGVFAISISPSSSSHHHKNGRPGSGRNTPSNGFYQHRYHANVLEALDNPANPLHAVLGCGDVRRQLWRAKDLRNRWKNVDDQTAGAGSKMPALPLESYDLEGILTVIFEGFDRAFVVAEQFVLAEMQKGVAGEGVNGQSSSGEMMDLAATEEQQWEFMVEAMDWEAV